MLHWFNGQYLMLYYNLLPSAATCSMEQKRNKKRRLVPSAPRVCTRLHLGLIGLILAAPWHKKYKKSQARSKQIEGCGAVAEHVFSVCLKMIEHDTPQNRKEHDDKPVDLPNLVMTDSLPWYRWPIEIDGLPNLKMVDLSMAKWQCHNQWI